MMNHASNGGKMAKFPNIFEQVVVGVQVAKNA